MARQTRSEGAVKDEVALKKAGKKDATGKATAAATAGKERKVRIQDDKADKPAKKSSKKVVKSAAAELVPSLDPNGQTGTEQVAPTEIINEAETKHTPKHRDGKKQPSKSVIKKTKKRKADAVASDEENEADDSAAAETSLAGQSAAGEDDDEDVEAGEIDFLAGFESGSDDEDVDGAENSSDEEDAAPITAKDLPQPTTSKAIVKQASKGKAKKDVPGVIYLGRIPHGFHEDEMRPYFEQFGEVTRLRLSRNRETGASKHYAFIEFLHSGVADIVAETMNNYLLNGHILQCRVIPSEEVHPKLWIGANRKFRPIPKGRVERLKHNAPKTEEQKEGIKKRLIKREDNKRNKLKDLGIEYDFDGYSKKAAALPSAQEKKAITDAKKLETEVKKDAPSPAPVAAKTKAPAAKTSAKPNKKARKST